MVKIDQPTKEVVEEVLPAAEEVPVEGETAPAAEGEVVPAKEGEAKPEIAPAPKAEKKAEAK